MSVDISPPRSRVPRFTAVLLLLMTANVLLFNIPQQTSEYITPALVYCFMTALAVFFGIWLSEGELSPAHAIGMVAFLSAPPGAWQVMLWAVFFGGGLGILGGAFQRGRIRRASLGMRLVFGVARVTLSFYASAQLYLLMGAQLPLETVVHLGNPDAVAALVLYVLMYLGIYTALFMLELYMNRFSVPSILATNLLSLLVILLLPIPFALLGAEILTTLSTPTELTMLLALVLIVLGLHALSRSEAQLRKQLDELQTLSSMTQTVRSHLDLETLLRTIYLQIAHVLKVENCTIALYNFTTKTMEYPLVMRHGQEEQTEQNLRYRLYHHGLVQHVFMTGRSMLISKDVKDKARSIGLEPPREVITSWMGAPLQAGEHEFGVISIFPDSPTRRFNQNDLRLLNIIVASASIAIENAQLYQQQTERTTRMSTLNHIGALLSGTLSPDTVLDTVISSASAISEANAVSVYLFWDDTKAELPLARSAGLSQRFIDNPPKPLLSQDDLTTLHLKMPIAVRDIERDPQTQAASKLLTDEGQRSLVELPLVIGENSLGVLVMYFNTMQSFNGELLELYRSFATQAAQAINNARLYASTDQAFQRSVVQLVELEDIGRKLTSTIDLQKICALMLNRSITATYAIAGVVALYSNDRRKLNLMASMGYTKETHVDDEFWKQGTGLLALESGQLQRLNSLSKSHMGMALTPRAQAQLSVPIRQGKQSLGFILLESDRLAGFTEEDGHFVSQITNQAVIAIENARLFASISEARDRLQVILDTMEEGIILIDTQGSIALANPCISMLGLEADTLLNTPTSTLLDDPALKLTERLGFGSRAEVEHLIHTLNTRGKWTSYEPTTYSIQLQESTRHMQRYIMPVPGENEQTMGALLVFYDKTEEQELAQTREELSRMIVHDLRSPLTAVTTSMKLLKDYVPKDSSFYSLVQTTAENSRRSIRKILSRVDSLLDIAKMQSGRLEVITEIVELGEMVEAVFTELTPLAHELEITMVQQIAADTPPLDVDADKAERLILNVVDNAIKYSPMHGQVMVRASHYRPSQATPTEGNNTNGNHQQDFVRVDVIDNGPGIPDDYKEALFGSFVQVAGRERVRRGVGLGLAFCKMVTDAHGGRIWIEDNPDGGSIFSFTLPAVRLTPPDEPDEDDATPHQPDTTQTAAPPSDKTDKSHEDDPAQAEPSSRDPGEFPVL